MTKYVQFSDDSETVIVSVFSCAQDEFFYKYQGEVNDNDGRYVHFVGSTIKSGPSVDDEPEL